MFQFNGQKGKRTKRILAIVTIVLVLAMILGAIIGAMYSVL